MIDMSGVSAARMNDVVSGKCYCHKDPISVSGIIVVVSTDVFANGLGLARIGDIAVATCGHTGMIATGSGSVFTNGIGNARLGDTTSGCFVGTIATGSSDTFIGE